MATRTARVDSRDQYIENQIRKTRGELRGVELAGRLMVLLVGTLAYFLLVAVFDHWIVPGGLGIWSRLFFLAVLLIGGAAYLFQQIVPLFLYRINPVFAAHTIERSKPSLKNSLVNFLMLRSQRGGVPDVVYQAIEEQAAANLTQTPIDHAVDRSKVIHIGYVLLGMVVAFAAYVLVSPKNPLDTVGRVVLPWSDILPPTRVAIREIDPGSTTVYRGEHVTIAAEILRLGDGEPVKLYYSTADRQIVDQPVIMFVPKNGYRHSCTLPVLDESVSVSPENGLQQDIDYRIVAGDAISHTYRLSVVQAPNIMVEKVVYAYPKYTGRAPETIERTGDLRGLEGTQVTIHAVANQPIKSAFIDFDGRGLSKRAMKVDGQQAAVTLTLAMNKDRTGPEFGNYYVRFVNEADRANPEPVRYRIEVTPDYAPEIEFLKPAKTETDVALDANITLQVQASDPDFALTRVNIAARVREQAAFVRYLLPTATQKIASGRFTQMAVVRLSDVRLKDGTALAAGDEIEYWAEAIDNKTPNGNAAKTEIRKLRIGQPSRGRNQQNPQNEQQPNENQQGGNGDPQNSDQQNGNRQPDDSREQNGGKQPQNDGQNNPNDNRGNRQQREPNDPPNRNEQPEGNNAGDNRPEPNPADAKGNDPNNAKQNDSKQQKQPNADDKNPPNGAKQNPGDNPNDKSGDQQAGDPQNAGQKGNDQKNGDSKNGNLKNSDPKNKDPKNSDKSGDRQNDARKNPAGQGGAEGNPGNQDRNADAAQGANDRTGDQPQEKRPVEKEGEDDRAIQNILDHARTKEGKTPDSPKNDDAKNGGSNNGATKQPNPAENNATKQNEPADAKNDASKQNGPKNDGPKNDGPKNDSTKNDQAEQENAPGADDQKNDNMKDKTGAPKNAGQKNADQKGTESKDPEQKSPEQKGAAKKSPDQKGTEQKGTDQKNQADQKGTPPKGADQQGADKQGADNQNSEKKTVEKQGAGKSGAEKGAAEKGGNEKSGAQQQGDAMKQPGDKAGTEKSNTEKSNTEKSNAQQNPNQSDQKTDQQPGKGAEPENAPGKRSDDKSGEKGSGKSEKSSETPAPQEKSKPTDSKNAANKATEKSGDNTVNKAQSPAHGNKDSSTESDSDGEKKGGGKKGGGKNDNQAGKGSAGSHESADDGAKKSKEPGAGETGKKAGEGEKADGQTGKSSADQKGAGSESKKSSDGQGGQPSDKSGDSNMKSKQGDQGAKADPGGKDPQHGPNVKQPGSKQGDGQHGDQPGEPNQNKPETGKQSSTGQNADGTGGEAGPPPNGPLVDPGEDKANLEYAKKATDLALDHLRNQLKKGEPDQELLDKLGGWSKDDLASLLQRWEKMERDAQQTGPQGTKAKANLDDAIRSLGLRPGRTQRAATRNADDQARGLREAARTAPPPEYADQYRAFQKGTSRGR